MYTILGATGHTGGVVAEKLLSKGEKVRVVGRSAQRLERFTQRGAEAAVAEATDADALTKAFAGSKAVYVLIPPNISAPEVKVYQQYVAGAVAVGIERNRISHAVVLSSVGADKSDRTGPVVGLHELEQKLGQILGLNVLFLRAGYFMENILPQVGVIQNAGMMAGPVRADLALPMIATRDIGAAATDALLKLDFSGKRTRELLGPRDVTYKDIARIVGQAIGKPDLAYAQMPPDQLKPLLMQMGMSANMADLLLEMSDALNHGYMEPLEARSDANSTPTMLETFVAEEFVPAFRGKAARA